MSEPLAEIVLPDRPFFKPAEVCELLKLQPYVLRTWENEFTDLGAEKTPGGPRVYRRHDVERAVRIRQLVFGEGLTLAGARRRLEAERPPELDEADLALEAAAAGSRPALTAEARGRLLSVRAGLRGLLDQLSRPAGASAAAAPVKAAEEGAAGLPATAPGLDTTPPAGVDPVAPPPEAQVGATASTAVPVAAGVVPPLPFDAVDFVPEPDLARAGTVTRDGDAASVEATAKAPRRRRKSAAV